ncbi:MAG: hypothetical protein N2110_05025 [Flavobacteriales bacterium]|nr:hypothetical protein [Flavobacteriales bacterium]MCX7768367.1 hypothetical protein [Flavobacteriales bacterium]MDW8409073.1 hypothetical protein [Flavobacteriales bacterium]
MHSFRASLKIFLASVAGCMFWACEGGSFTATLAGAKAGSGNLAIAEPEVFSQIPLDLRGCGCFFAHDSTSLARSQYIFVSDMESRALVKLNGAFQTLVKSQSRNINEFDVEEEYTSDSLHLLLKVSDKGNCGNNHSRKEGTLILYTPQGQSREITFLGHCGC